MPKLLTLLLVFTAGAAFSWIATRPTIAPALESRDVATVSPLATHSPPTVGAVALGEARQPGIPPAVVGTIPTNPNARAAESRALAQAMRKLQKHPPESPPGDDLDDETVARIGDAVRARSLALQGEAK